MPQIQPIDIQATEKRIEVNYEGRLFLSSLLTLADISNASGSGVIVRDFSGTDAQYIVPEYDNVKSIEVLYSVYAWLALANTVAAPAPPVVNTRLDLVAYNADIGYNGIFRRMAFSRYLSNMQINLRQLSRIDIKDMRLFYAFNAADLAPNAVFSPDTAAALHLVDAAVIVRVVMTL